MNDQCPLRGEQIVEIYHKVVPKVLGMNALVSEHIGAFGRAVATAAVEAERQSRAINALAASPPPSAVPATVTEEMVRRFLCWKLPRDFGPDCGINFDGRKDDEWNKNKTWPVGTNLLTAEQAKAMLGHVLAAAPKEPI